MKILIPFDSSSKPIQFYGNQERVLPTVKREKTYKLRSLFIMTGDFAIGGIRGQGTGQSVDLGFAPSHEVVGVELPMPEWIVEPGQLISLTLFNINPAARDFGGYFIGEI